MKKLFGTDGIRGVAGKEPITLETCIKLARAISFMIHGKHNQAKESTKPSVLIGKDTRISSDMIEHGMASAFCAYGIDVYLAGVIPTPGASILVADSGSSFSFGIMISASHNPFQDNGIKLFDKDGFKLSDEQEMEIENLMLNWTLNHDSVLQQLPVGTHANIGRILCGKSLIQGYCDRIKRSFHFSQSKTNSCKLLIDMSNGCFSKIAPEIFEFFGFKNKILINDEPNGININDNCGAANSENLARETLKHNADFAIAFDGDGDRVLMCGSDGHIIDGDDILAILVSMKCQGTCSKNDIKDTTNVADKSDVIVSTIMSNYGLEKYLNSVGVRLIRANVGDRYVCERMQQLSANIGGEPSGHIIIREHSLTGDGLFVALKILEYAINNDIPFSSLGNIYKKYPVISANIIVENKDILQNRSVNACIQSFQKQMENNGKLIVRASGTESLIRINAEGEDVNELQSIVNAISKLIIETEQKTTGAK